MMRYKHLLAAALCSAALAACGGSGSSDNEPDTGTLDLKITDSPVDDAAEVVVVFTGVELKPANGEPFSIDYCDVQSNPEDCRSIDLLLLQDGVTDDLLVGETVEAGEYEWMRLKVLAEMNQQDGSYILLENGEQYPLFVPSGAQTGLKLVRPFTVAVDGTTRLVVDFDVRKSVIAPPGLAPNYLLKPTLRLMDELQTGTIDGVVDLAELGTEQENEACIGGVYLFREFGATPDDMDGNDEDGADPVVFHSLEADEDGGTAASYMLSFIEAGDYTIAFTCNFDVDVAPDESEYDPTAEEGEDGFGTMAWTALDVTVAVGETLVVDYPQVP